MWTWSAGSSPSTSPSRARPRPFPSSRRPPGPPARSSSPPTPIAKARRSRGTSPTRSRPACPPTGSSSRRSPGTPCSPRCSRPGAIDERKVEAQQARRILDRLVGYKASPILWRTIKTGLSAGRVQTVALRLLVEREREIRAFKPQEYWTIEALCAKDGQTFEASLAKVEGHKPQLHNEAEARAVVDAVRGLPFVVTKVERRNRRKRPYAPFTTSTLQQEAAKKLGFSGRRTMRAAQDLYEGIDVGEDGAVGLITYMRTDSVRVSDQAVTAARELIGSQYGKPYLPDAPNTYSDRKNARVQGAHEAIRPTDVRRRPEQVQKYLEPDQFRLYQLIWQRFVASQMMPAVYDMTVVEFDLGKYLFRASGSVMIFDGYHVLYTEGAGDGGGARRRGSLAHSAARPGRPGGGPRDHPVAALHRAAAALLRGEPGEGARAARHRPAVHLQRHHLDARGPRVRQGGAAALLPHRAGRDGREDHGRASSPRSSTSSSPPRWRTELDRVEEGELGWQRVLAGLLRALHQGARRGGHERARRRRARHLEPRTSPRSAAPSAARRSSSGPGASGRTSHA